MSVLYKREIGTDCKKNISVVLHNLNSTKYCSLKSINLNLNSRHINLKSNNLMAKYPKFKKKYM